MQIKTRITAILLSLLAAEAPQKRIRRKLGKRFIVYCLFFLNYQDFASVHHFSTLYNFHSCECIKTYYNPINSTGGTHLNTTLCNQYFHK